MPGANATAAIIREVPTPHNDMPTRWKIRIDGQNLPDVRTEFLHAVVSGWLDPPGEHRSQAKPYTISPLARDDSPLAAGRSGVWELTLLDDRLCSRFDDAVAAAQTAGIRLGRERYALSPPELLQAESYRDLTGPSVDVGPVRRFGFQLHTPTTFRKGQRSEPLPTPQGVFGHLRRRWNEYCGADLQMRLDITSCDLLVAAIAGESVEWDVRLGANGKRVPWRGFVGFVEFEAGSACSSLDLSNLAVLTRLSAYAGVGANTTVGFGICSPTFG